MRVVFLASEAYGGGNLRSIWPADALAKRGYDTGWTVNSHAVLPADVVIIHRPLALDRLDALRRFKDAGCRVLVDEDDDLSRVHQTKNTVGLEIWTPERKDLHAQTVREADGLIVTTPALAEVYGPMAAKTWVCPNYLPADVKDWTWNWGRPQPWPRVGWTGIVATHRHDLEWLAPVARPMLIGALFETIGDPVTLKVLGVGGKVYPFQYEMRVLYRLQSRADIGIVPLAPIEFNHSKSWLKALEFMSVGVPVVASDLPEQRRLITDGEDGFLASTPEEFAHRVRTLIEDPELRTLMSKRAKEKTAAMNLDAMAGCWEAAVLGSEPTTS